MLGHLVKDMKFKSLDKSYFFSLPIKESEIIDFFFLLGISLKDKVWKIMQLQKQTLFGSRTQFKASVSLGTTMDMSVWVLSAPRR